MVYQHSCSLNQAATRPVSVLSRIQGRGSTVTKAAVPAPTAQTPHVLRLEAAMAVPYVQARAMP